MKVPLHIPFSMPALVMSPGGRIGKDQACPTTRKLNVNSIVRITLPSVKLSGQECTPSASTPSTLTIKQPLTVLHCVVSF